MEDGKIVDLYLARDERAIIETSEKYGKALQSISRRIVLDEGASEECLNDTWLKTWESIPPHEPRDYLFAFLAKITRALSMSYCRKVSAKKRSATVISLSDELSECIGDADPIERKIDEIIFTESINRFLRDCSTEKRDMFVRRYFYMDDIKQIAKRHNCKESKVTTELYRLRKKLKKQLEEDNIM